MCVRYFHHNWVWSLSFSTPVSLPHIPLLLNGGRVLVGSLWCTDKGKWSWGMFNLGLVAYVVHCKVNPHWFKANSMVYEASGIQPEARIFFKLFFLSSNTLKCIYKLWIKVTNKLFDYFMIWLIIQIIWIYGKPCYFLNNLVQNIDNKFSTKLTMHIRVRTLATNCFMNIVNKRCLSTTPGTE